MVKKAFTTWQMLRYPAVFGCCLAMYFLAFSYRKEYFKDEIDSVREKNYRQAIESAAKIEEAKHLVREELKKK